MRRDHDVDGRSTLNDELQSNSSPTSLDDVKDTTLAFLDDVIAATDRMLSDVQAAGVPDVTDGGEAARRVSTALGDVRDALAGARDRVEGLSNDDPEAFGSELATIGEDLRESSRTRPARWSPSRSRAGGGRRRRPGVRPARGVSLLLGGTAFAPVYSS